MLNVNPVFSKYNELTTGNSKEVKGQEFQSKLNDLFYEEEKKDEYVESTQKNFNGCEVYHYPDISTLHKKEEPKELTQHKSEEEDVLKEEGNPQEDSTSNSNIVVKADGSRVLVVTMKIGGMESVTSIQISEPTEFMPDAKADEGVNNTDSVQNMENVEK